MSPSDLEALFRDGNIAFIASGILLVEALCLVLIARRSAVTVIANGLSGLFLILALNASLSGGGLPSVALWLSLGGLAHVADVIARLRP